MKRVANKTKDKRAFGLTIKSLRSLRQMTQEELSEHSNMHHTYLSSIERGERNPTLEKILGLARALNCSPKDLMPEN